MKVNLNPEISNKHNSFTGFYKNKNNLGKPELSFFYPFDDKNYDCYITFRDVIIDDNKIAKATYEKDITNPITHEHEIKLSYGENKVNLSDHFGINNTEVIAYRYKLVNKNNPNDIKWVTDAGLTIPSITKNSNEEFNIIYPHDMRVKKGGSMKLVIPDTYNPSWVYDKDNETHSVDEIESIKLQESMKTASNKIGGSLAGIEHDLDAGKFDNYSRIISTPVGTDDGLTAHAYWSKNNMQMALPLGNINNFQSLIRKMFLKDKNFVFDAALTNEGIEGIHFADVLKRGKKSPFYNWFNIKGLDLAPLNVSVFNDKDDYIAYRFINPENNYVQDVTGQIKEYKNHKYNKNAPTYLQVYDKRFVKDRFLKENELIKSYDKLTIQNKLDVNNSHDTIIPNSFMVVNPEDISKNIQTINEINKTKTADNKININSCKALHMIAKFENYNLENRNIDNGFYTWDSNPDILKLRYTHSNSDDLDRLKSLPSNERDSEKSEKYRYECEAEDYAITSGIYWSEKARDTLITYVAQQLKNINPEKPKDAYKLIMSKVNESKNDNPNPQLPLSLKDTLTEEMVKNVLDGTYEKSKRPPKLEYNEAILSGTMNFPLDSIEFGDDIVAAFSSHYMSKRASSHDEIGKTKYEMYKMGNPQLRDDNKTLYLKTQRIYEEELRTFTKEILSKVNSELDENMQIYDEKNGITPLGREVMPYITKDITKFAIIKGLVPTAEYWYDSKSGELSYDYNALKNIHLQTLGIKSVNIEGEVSDLTDKIRSGIKTIGKSDKDKLARAIRLSIKDTTPKSYDLARLIVDKTGAGLDWRIDAAKDIADIDSLRNKESSFEYVWSSVTGFWSDFAKNIHRVNPNSYMAAEITDENTLYDIGDGKTSGYTRKDIVPKFLNETGMTTTANYSYFFSTLAKIFSRETEDSKNPTFNNNDSKKAIYDKLIHNLSYDKPNPYLKSAPLESLLYSYNFIGNHDKPRILHCLALDMDLFFGDLTDKTKYSLREKAYKITHDKLLDSTVNSDDVNSADYTYISPKACAMGWTLNSGFGNTINTLFKDDKEKRAEVYEAIAKSLSDLTNGIYKGHYFEADGFGEKDFPTTIPLVIEQAKYAHGLNITREQEKEIKTKTFEYIIDRAISKLLGMMKVLVAIPGIPTLFSGDDLGSTGFEYKTKNITQANRNVNHNEWIDEKNIFMYKNFIAQHYKEFDKIMGLRNKPEMHSLNDGTPYVLQQQYSDNNAVTGILRQSKNGDMTLSLLNLNNVKNGDNVINYDNYYNPEDCPVQLDSIKLGEVNKDDIADSTSGLPAGLPEGTIFKNIKDKDKNREIDKSDDEKYVVQKSGNDYILVKVDKNNKPEPIIINDTVMHLYHEEPKPKVAKTPDFQGRLVMYNPQYHFISINKAYKENNTNEIGNNLKILSK